MKTGSVEQNTQGKVRSSTRAQAKNLLNMSQWVATRMPTSCKL